MGLLLVLCLNGIVEWRIEGGNKVGPSEFSLSDAVEIFLDPGGETVVHYVFEIVFQIMGYDGSHILREELVLLGSHGFRNDGFRNCPALGGV